MGKRKADSEVIIDGRFVNDKLQKLCEKRRSNSLELPLPCRPGPCELCPTGEGRCDGSGMGSCFATAGDLEWGTYAQCVGSCFIGDVNQSSWTTTCNKSRLRDCLVSSTNIDWLLHLSKKRYRDHSSHQLFVGVLGWFLLKCRLGKASGLTLAQWISRNTGLDEEYVEIAWWIASLLHDHAYPLAHMLRVVPSTVEVNRQVLLNQTWALLGFESQARGVSPLGTISSNLYDLALLTELREDVEASQVGMRVEIIGTLRKYLLHFFHQDELCKEPKSCYDHGLLAAANVAALLGTPRDNSVMKAAIRAIGIHNGAACSERVDVQKDPLAFLLVLCDECQEWGRRILVGDEARAESENIRLVGLEQINGQYVIDECLTVVFEYPQAGCLEETGWDYSLFRRSKEKAFRRLNVPLSFPIKRLEYRVLIPHVAEFCSP